MSPRTAAPRLNRLNPHDEELIRHGERALNDWVKNMRRSGASYTFASASPRTVAMPEFGSYSPVEAVNRMAQNVKQAITGMQLPRLAMQQGYAGKLILGGVVAATASLAIAATVVVNGYISHPEAFWIERITERMQSPIYGADGTTKRFWSVIGKTLFCTTAQLMIDKESANCARLSFSGAFLTIWRWRSVV